MEPQERHGTLCVRAIAPHLIRITCTIPEEVCETLEVHQSIPTLISIQYHTGRHGEQMCQCEIPYLTGNHPTFFLNMLLLFRRRCDGCEEPSAGEFLTMQLTRGMHFRWASSLVFDTTIDRAFRG